jgi:hypothetical protein
MNQQFAINEIAIFVGDSSVAPRGTEVRIVSTERLYLGRADGPAGYTVEVPGVRSSSPCGLWFAQTVALRKKKPPALDRECYRVTSWDDGVWRPKEMPVVFFP